MPVLGRTLLPALHDRSGFAATAGGTAEGLRDRRGLAQPGRTRRCSTSRLRSDARRSRKTPAQSCRDAVKLLQRRRPEEESRRAARWCSARRSCSGWRSPAMASGMTTRGAVGFVDESDGVVRPRRRHRLGVHGRRDGESRVRRADGAVAPAEGVGRSRQPRDRAGERRTRWIPRSCCAKRSLQLSQERAVRLHRARAGRAEEQSAEGSDRALQAGDRGGQGYVAGRHAPPVAGVRSATTPSDLAEQRPGRRQGRVHRRGEVGVRAAGEGSGHQVRRRRAQRAGSSRAARPATRRRSRARTRTSSRTRARSRTTSLMSAAVTAAQGAIRRKDAIKLFEAARAVNPYHRDVLYNLARLYLLDSAYAKGIADGAPARRRSIPSTRTTTSCWRSRTRSIKKGYDDEAEGVRGQGQGATADAPTRRRSRPS